MVQAPRNALWLSKLSLWSWCMEFGMYFNVIRNWPALFWWKKLNLATLFDYKRTWQSNYLELVVFSKDAWLWQNKFQANALKKYRTDLSIKRNIKIAGNFPEKNDKIRPEIKCIRAFEWHFPSVDLIKNLVINNAISFCLKPDQINPWIIRFFKKDDKKLNKAMLTDYVFN